MLEGLKQAIASAVAQQVGNASSGIAEAVNQGVNPAVTGLATKLAHFLVGTSYTIALIGGGILILLYIAGYKNGMRYTGVLFVSHVLIRYLFG